MNLQDLHGMLKSPRQAFSVTVAAVLLLVLGTSEAALLAYFGWDYPALSMHSVFLALGTICAGALVLWVLRRVLPPLRFYWAVLMRIRPLVAILIEASDQTEQTQREFDLLRDDLNKALPDLFLQVKQLRDPPEAPSEGGEFTQQEREKAIEAAWQLAARQAAARDFLRKYQEQQGLRAWQEGVSRLDAERAKRHTLDDLRT